MRKPNPVPSAERKSLGTPNDVTDRLPRRGRTRPAHRYLSNPGR